MKKTSGCVLTCDQRVKVAVGLGNGNGNDQVKMREPKEVGLRAGSSEKVGLGRDPTFGRRERGSISLREKTGSPCDKDLSARK